MSKTDKTRPARVQIAYVKDKHGEAHINWHTDVAWRRYKGDGEWTNEIRHRKDRYYSITDGIMDYLDIEEEKVQDEDDHKEGCMWCCGGYDY
jgi:hypothetical protein